MAYLFFGKCCNTEPTEKCDIASSNLCSLPQGQISDNQLCFLLETGCEFARTNGNAAIVSDPEKDCALEITYPANSLSAVQAPWEIPCLQSNDVWMSYDVKFMDGFQFVKGGKMPGLAGGCTPTGGVNSQSEIDCGFTARMMWGGGTGSQNLQLYLYWQGMPTNFPNTSYGQYYDTGILPQDNKWYTITQYVKLGTAGNSDGEISIWVDGVQVINLTNIMLLPAGQSWCIDYLFFSTFYGGGDSSWEPSIETKSRYANFCVGTTGNDINF